MLEGKIIAIEPQCEGEAHAQFNSDFLKKYASQNCEVALIAEQNHIIAVKSRTTLLKKEVFLDKLPINRISRLNQFGKLVHMVMNLRQKNSTILFLSSPGIFLFLIPIFLFFCSNIKVIHHGLTENLLHEKYTMRIIFRSLYRFLSYFKKIDNIIIGEHARESFSLCGVDPSKFTFIRMPFTRVENKRTSIKQDGPVKFVTIGQQSFEKGFIHVLHVFQTFNTLNAKVSICGFLNDEVYYWLQRKKIEIGVTKKMISKSELQIGIEAADVVFFTYPPELYRMTSSAAYFEALKYNKKIFALGGNKFFEYEAKLNGNLVLCKDIEEMCTKLFDYSREPQCNA